MRIPSTMRAAVLDRPGEIRLVEKPVPELGADEVLVKVHRATLCGTDLKILSQSFFPDGPPHPSFSPGHEYAGEIVALGDSVDEFEIGDRIVTEAHRGCMRCSNCLRGGYTECLNYGHSVKGHRAQGMTVDGGLAEFVVNHVSTVHRIPDGVSFDEATLLVTAGTVLHAVDALTSMVLGARVTVIGPGPIGLLAVQILRELGASMVSLVGRRQQRLDIGTALGADLAVLSDNDPVGTIRAATGGHGVDIVLECSGAPSAVDQALQLCRRGDTIVLVGFFSAPVTAALNDAVMKGITLLTVRGEGADSVRRAVALAARGRLQLQPLITHRFPLEKVATAYEVYGDRSHDAIKVMIDVVDVT